MGFYKILVICCSALVAFSSFASATTKASVDQAQLANVRQVGNGDTLWRIASTNVFEDVSVWQFLISIYQLNPHAFVDNDISRLRVNAQLLLPTVGQITTMSRAQAQAAVEQLLTGNSQLLNAHESIANEPVELIKEIQVHKVRSGETLFRIAANANFEGVSVLQMLLSIYQLNLNAFFENDISRLRKDSLLLMPTRAQATSLSPDVAKLTYERMLFASSESLSLVQSRVLEVAEPVTQADQNAAGAVIENVTEDPTEDLAIAVLTQGFGEALAKEINPVPPESPFLLKKITIIGNESFSGETLHALLADAEGTEQDIEQLGKLAARITQFYQGQGYSLVRAVVPAQTISEGNVTIQVIEAKYGQVNMINNSRVTDGLLEATLAPMQSGTVISDANMYSSLLLLSDIPGLVINSTLSPGAKVGSSDVTLEVKDSDAYSASVSVDQHGDIYTGKERVSGSLSISNLAGHGDTLSMSGMSSGPSMNFGRVAYDVLLNGKGTHVGASYAGLNYHLGDELLNTRANGSTRVSSVWVLHPLLLSLDNDVSVQLQYDVNQLNDRIDSASMSTDRTIPSFTFTLAGDKKNTHNLGGFTGWSVRLKSGDLHFDDASAANADASSANTAGKFEKINLNINHLQNISNRSSVYLNVKGQWANQNLDSSEKLVAGGANAVRAYNSGALSGDTGVVGSIEYRYYLTQAFEGMLIAGVFYDTAHVMVNEAPWQGLTSANSAMISGAGTALYWTGPEQMSANLELAMPTDSKSSLVSERPKHTVRLKLRKDF
jgi:FimV-like protein